MARNKLLVWVGLAAVAALLAGVVFRSSSDGSGVPGSGSGADSGPGMIEIPLGGGSSGGDGSSGGPISGIVNSTPLPDGAVQLDPVVNPINAGTDGAVWQGPDPFDLAPGSEEGQNDLIAPVNPGNVVAGGPVWTGPDPFNLGGN